MCKIQGGCPGNWEVQQGPGGGVKEGGERVLLLVEKADAQKSVVPSVGTTPPKRGRRRGPVLGSQCLGSQQGALVKRRVPLAACAQENEQV